MRRASLLAPLLLAAPLCFLAPGTWRGRPRRPLRTLRHAEAEEIDWDTALDVDMEDLVDSFGAVDDEDDEPAVTVEPRMVNFVKDGERKHMSIGAKYRSDEMETLRKEKGMSEEEASLLEEILAKAQTATHPAEVDEQFRKLEELRKKGKLAQDEGPAKQRGPKDETEWLEQNDFTRLRSRFDENAFTVMDINTTWAMSLATVPGAMDEMFQIMRKEPGDLTQEDLDFFKEGDTVYSASMIMARFLALYPPRVDLEGKRVLEIGAGLGLPSVVAACLGSTVLSQDKEGRWLQVMTSTAKAASVLEYITILCCTWADLPSRLMFGEKELEGWEEPDIILGSDIIFNEQAEKDVANVLVSLLRRPEQKAYITEPNRNEQERQNFRKRLRRNGLESTDVELCTWEPNTELKEVNGDHIANLITVWRM